MKISFTHIATLISLVGLFLFSSSCSGGSLSKKELKDWASKAENGFYKEKTIGDVSYSVQLVPNELMNAPTKEQKANFQITIKGANPAVNLRSNLTKSYGAAVKRYYAFEIENNIILETETKKIRPDLCHFEQGTDLANDFRLILAFDTQFSEDIILVIDPKFPASGKVRFKFKKEDILKKPFVKEEKPEIPS